MPSGNEQKGEKPGTKTYLTFEMPEVLEVQDGEGKEREAEYALITEQILSRDWYDLVVIVSGIDVAERFKKNPILLNTHGTGQRYGKPRPTCEDAIGTFVTFRKELDHDPPRMIGRARYMTNENDPTDPCERIWERVRQKVIRMVSIGIDLHKSVKLEAEAEWTDPKSGRKWKATKDRSLFVIVRSGLYEVSNTPIGLDPDSLALEKALALSAGETDTALEGDTDMADKEKEGEIKAAAQRAEKLEAEEKAKAQLEAEKTGEAGDSVTVEIGGRAEAMELLEVAKVVELDADEEVKKLLASGKPAEQVKLDIYELAIKRGKLGGEALTDPAKVPPKDEGKARDARLEAEYAKAPELANGGVTLEEFKAGYED